MYIPLDRSNANVCTLVKMPDLTKNVPNILRINVSIDNNKTQERRDFFFSTVIRECNKAVPRSQGIKEAFSTGSQNYHPPHPNS